MDKQHENGALISACEAARQLGISNAAISRALTSGRLPYVEKTKHGYRIDPEVLQRVFADSPGLLAKQKRTVRRAEDNENDRLRQTQTQLEAEVRALRYERDLERKRADAAEKDRDAWRALSIRLTNDAELKI